MQKGLCSAIVRRGMLCNLHTALHDLQPVIPLICDCGDVEERQPMGKVLKEGAVVALAEAWYTRVDRLQGKVDRWKWLKWSGMKYYDCNRRKGPLLLVLQS